MVARAINRSGNAITKTLPAPVGGLNARDSLSAMPPTDASVMENWFPYADRVATRAGFSALATQAAIGHAGTVEGWRAFARWSGASGEQIIGFYAYQELVAAADRTRMRAYNIALNGTISGAFDFATVGAAEFGGNLGEWTEFTNAAGTHYLVVPYVYPVSAATQLVFGYDGTNWTSLAVTGLPGFVYGVHSHRNRLWFYGNASTSAAKPLSAFYLPIGAAAGAVTEFNLGPYASKGGKLVAMRTWTLDGGVGGSDDCAVFVTDRGQALVFSGYDPATVSTWSLVGVFDIGRAASPTIGSTAACDAVAMKYGADLLFLVESGLVTANKVLRPINLGEEFTLTSKIRPLITDAIVTYGANGSSTTGYPWKLIFIPTLRQLIINVPTATATANAMTTVTSVQYVMNTETGAWTKFTGINMQDLIVAGNYVFLTDGSRTIYKYGVAADDGGTPITFECRQAYTYLDSPDNKQATLMAPQFRATGSFTLTAQVDADFNARSISTYITYVINFEQNVKVIASGGQMGRAFAAHLKGQTNTGTLSWYTTSWAAKPGGFL